MFVFLYLTDHPQHGSRILSAVIFALGRDGAVHTRRLLHGDVPVPPSDGEEGGVVETMIDVRMFTVGPVQENCYFVRRPDATVCDRDRSGR